MKTFVHHPRSVSALPLAVASLIVGLSVLLGFVMLGCSTVAPKVIKARQGSFDAVPDAKGNYQNSGVLGFTNGLAIITPTARARYNALVVKWGVHFLPPVKPDDGLTLMTVPVQVALPLGGQPSKSAELWLMDKDHLDKWATMATWQLQPPPVKPP